MRHDDSSPPASPDDQPLLAALSQASAAIAGCPDMDLDAQLVAVLDDIGPALGVAAVTVWSASNPSAPLQRMFSWRHEPTAFESDEPGEGTVLVPVAGSDLNHTVVEIETAGVHHAEREYLEILAGVIGQASARRDHAERFNAAFAEASVAMSIRSIEGRLIACNPAYRLLHGLIEEHAAAELPLDLVHEEDRPHVEHARAELLAGRRSSYQLEIRLQTPGGQRWVRTSTSAIRSADGTLRSVLTLLEDVTQQRLTGEVLEHHATHDTLTGLPNRLLTMHHIEAAIHRAPRQHGVLGLLLVDIDHFKQVNDSFGHAAGDELLTAIGKRLRGAVRDADVVSRLGGDEFCVIAESCESPDMLLEISRRIHDAVSQPIELAGNELSPTVSIGVAVTDRSTPASELLREADSALYRAKTSGRARTDVFDTDLRAEVARRAAFTEDVQRALEQNEFQLYGQPEVDLGTGLLRAVEVFVRWRHPERGLLDAGEFAPDAVASRTISEIDDWVASELAATLDRVRIRPGVPLRLNVSGLTLRQPGWIASLVDRLEPSGARLTLEVPASDLVGGLERYRPAFRTMCEAGIGLVIDDFGMTGSGLQDLRAIPASVVKLDGSLIADSDARPRGAQVLEALVQLADALGLETVAEGVERPSQLARLRTYGCTAGQGNLLAKPSDLEPLLRSFG